MSTEPAPNPARSRRAFEPGRPFVLGLVGRSGSGKSTVARALVADGARLVDADRIGHQVTDGDPEVRAALIAEYGAGVYRADGALDRAQVAARVFHDPEARRRLDRLTHPRILRRIERLLDGFADEGFEGVVVIDAALMLDWGLERQCHAVIAVTAPESARIARLVAARGWTPEEARARLAVQRSDEAFRAAADRTLDNAGTEAELSASARAAVRELRR